MSAVFSISFNKFIIDSIDLILQDLLYQAYHRLFLPAL